MSFFDHVTITLKTGIADHVKSDTCNHANKAVSFECYRWYHLSAMINYVNHFSEEWQNEYEEYCKVHALCIGNESAEQFVKYKDELLEQGMETENA